MTSLLREHPFTRFVSRGHSLFVFLTALAGCASPASTSGPVAQVKSAGGPGPLWPEKICPREPFPIATREAVSSNAGVYTHGYFVPNPNLVKTVATPIELRIGDAKRSYPPDYGCIKSFGVAAGPGTKGTPGGSASVALAKGGTQEDRFALAPTSATAGNTGGLGGTGGDGGPGSKITVFATLVRTKFHPKLVAITVEGAATDFLLVPFGAPVTIYARGGDGGGGGGGGAGGAGADGNTILGARKTANDPPAPPPTVASTTKKRGPTPPTAVQGSHDPKAIVLGASGGDGGIGGNGGPGGAGGSGGTIVLYVDNRFPEIRDQITLDVSGGHGGDGGQGGAGGIGGFAAIPPVSENWKADPMDPRTPKNGSIGAPGTLGAKGKDGARGSATVLLDEIAIAPVAGIEML